MSNADMVTLKLNIKPLVMLVAKMQARTRGIQEINNEDTNSIVATRIIPGSPARSATKKLIAPKRLCDGFKEEFGPAEGITDTQIIPDSPTCLIPKNKTRGKSPVRPPSHLSDVVDCNPQVDDELTDTKIIPDSPAFLIVKKPNIGGMPISDNMDDCKLDIRCPEKEDSVKSSLHVYRSPTRRVPNAPLEDASRNLIIAKIPTTDYT